MFKRITAFVLILTIVLTGLSAIGGNSLSMTAEAAFKYDQEPYSPSVFMINTDTGVTVYEKNPDELRYPASTTKVMTALIAIELCPDLSTMVTIDDRVMEDLLWTDSSRSGLVARERISMLDLLYCLMLPSGNDAALAIAYYLGDGSVEHFVELMNERAERLGCTNTHFANPHGLHNDNHYTTARDLAKICTAAMEIPVFAEIVAQRIHYIEATNKNERRYVLNTNHLLNVNYSTSYYYVYCKGIKTGRTDKAGNCFCGYATRNGYNYICICLGAAVYDETGKKLKYNLSFIDAKELFEWAFSTLTLVEVLPSSEVIAEVPLNLAWNRDSLTLVPESSYKTLLPTAVKSSSIYRQVNIPESVDAPIKKGDVIGTVTLIYAYEEIGTVNLVASESIERSEMLYFLSIINKGIQSTAFKVIFIVIIALIIVYVAWALLFNRNAANRNRRRQQVTRRRRM